MKKQLHSILLLIYNDIILWEIASQSTYWRPSERFKRLKARERRKKGEILSKNKIQFTQISLTCHFSNKNKNHMISKTIYYVKPWQPSQNIEVKYK
jgi:hypothetical protein